jgi:site-specific recombinase XerD
MTFSDGWPGDRDGEQPAVRPSSAPAEPLRRNPPYAAGRDDSLDAAEIWGLSELTRQRFLLGHSGNTREAYQRDLNEWWSFCSALSIPPLDAKRHHLDQFRNHLQTNRRLAPATVSRRLSAVSQWFAYALDEGLLTASPMRGVRRPKVDNLPTTDALSREEILAAFNAVEDDARLYALCQLLFGTGMRISSALGLDVEDLRTQQGFRVAHFRAKGERRGVAVLSAPVVAALESYLDGRRSGPVFLGAGGCRWDRKSAWRALRQLGEKVLPDKPNAFHPHSWRAAFVTAAHLSGVSLVDIQDATLHADIRTLESRYIRARRRLDRHPGQQVLDFLNSDAAPD